MEGLPALWLQLSQGQVASHRMWGSVASDYQCSSTLTKGIPSHKNLLEWARQDHLPKRKCTSLHMSICLFYLNSFEVLLSDFNKKRHLIQLGTLLCIFRRNFKTHLLLWLVQFPLLVPEITFTHQKTVLCNHDVLTLALATMFLNCIPHHIHQLSKQWYVPATKWSPKLHSVFLIICTKGG
jgi:hypothetical protein